jgi:hypothetical protein
MNNKSNRPFIETLEARIAPAAIFSLTDVDGDIVTVKTSKGTDANLIAAMTTSSAGVGGQIREIDLSTNAVFAGTDLIVTVVKKPGGDGFVNIGAIDATSADGGAPLDLGNISIPGDLGQIDAGNNNISSTGVKSLKVRSLGALGLATQGGAGDLISLVEGGIGSLAVKGDIREATFKATNGSIDALTIGGSLIGGPASESGSVSSSGPIGVLKIAGDIVGGAGSLSGRVVTAIGIKSAFVGGNVTGGLGVDSGSVHAGGTINALTVGGSVVGGPANNSGRIFSDGDGASIVKVGGNLVGSAGDYSGELNFDSKRISLTVGGDLVGGSGIGSGAADFIFGDSAKVGGSIVGGSITGTAAMQGSGVVLVHNAGKLLVKGGIIAGDDNSSGGLYNSGAIAASGSIGALTVKGSITGSATHRAGISAAGPGTAPAGGTQELAIAKITIGGNVTRAEITAGFDNTGFGADFDGDSSIGSVLVKGDWSASSISAGVKDVNGNGYGNMDDVAIVPGNDGAIASRIASIIIGGSVSGSGAAGDHFAFVAQEIGIVRIGGGTVFTGTSSLDTPKALSAITGDMSVRETM